MNWSTPEGTVQREAETMLHTCERVTQVTDGHHTYDTAFVLRLCRAVMTQPTSLKKTVEDAVSDYWYATPRHLLDKGVLTDRIVEALKR